MPPEITSHLLAWIVDQLFDGTIDDESPIRSIYRLIAADQAAFRATAYALGASASLQSVLAERIRQIPVECFYPEQMTSFPMSRLQTQRPAMSCRRA